MIDPNCDNKNVALVNQYKIQLRIISNLILRTLRNHVTPASFKSFLPYKSGFAYINRATGEVKMAIEISKPDTIIDIRDLEENLELITLHPGCGNDIIKMVSEMLALYPEIHSRTGLASYTSRRFITQLFRAALTTPVERFETFVDGLKQQCIMEEVTD